MENQEKVWDNIAPEWHEFKTSPSLAATEFLNNKSGKILDFGGGSARNLLNINPKDKEITLVDFSAQMLKHALNRAKELKINLKTVHSKLEKTPLKDNYFDAAICVAAIHCVETKQKRNSALKELFRVLKPGAEAEIEVWNKDSPRYEKANKEKMIAWREKGKRYYYLYEHDELKKDLEKIGFKILKRVHHNANIVLILKKPKN